MNAAFLSACVLLVIDFLLGSRLGLPQDTITTWAAMQVALLPILTLGFLFGILPQEIRFIFLSGIMYTLGHQLAQGPRAQVMPLSKYWSVILAAGIFSVALTTHRLIRRKPEIERQVFRLLMLSALMVFVIATFVQRGRYQEVRDLANIFALALLWLPSWAWAKRLGEKAWIVGIIGLALGGQGFWLSINNNKCANWTIEQTSLARTYVIQARNHFATELAGISSKSIYVHQPILGSPLGDQIAHEIAISLGAKRGFLFITVDAMRADLVNRQVGGRQVLPFIDSLREESADFRRAYAPAPMTHFSVFSFLSGWYPSQVIGSQGGFSRARLITQTLGDNGIETRGCYPKGMLIAGGEKFSRFDLGFKTSSLHPWDDLSIQATFEQLRPQNEGPWFAYLHIMLPHHPYNKALPEFRAGNSEFENYAAEVRQADDFIKKLFEKFRAAGFADTMWMAVAADHGEEFGEHGSYRHSTQVFEESVHVPLVITGKGVVAKRHDQVVSLVDLAPTLHHFFQLPVGKSTVYAGRSWLPLALGKPDEGRSARVLVENPPRHLSRFNSRSALVGPKKKLIADERSRRLLLFDLSRDPKEKEEVSSQHPDLTQELWQELLAKRQFGGGNNDVFESMTSFRSFIEEAAQSGPPGVYKCLEWMKGLAKQDELELLSYFAEYEDPIVPKKIALRYKETHDAELQLMANLIQISATRPNEEQWLSLAQHFDKTGFPGIDEAILSVAAKWRLKIPQADQRELPSAALHAQLNWARYKWLMKGKIATPELIHSGLVSTSTWDQLLALRSAAGSSLITLRKDLMRIYKTTELGVLRLEALRRLSEQADATLCDFFLDVAQIAPPEEAAIAAATAAAAYPTHSLPIRTPVDTHT